MTKIRKWNRFSLEPDSAKQTRAMPLNSLRRMRTGGYEGRLCGSHSNSPQKVRTEDSGERWRTLNCPVRIPAELRSWNLSKTHFLHQRTSRNQGLGKEAGTRRGRPPRGGLAGTTGVEEKTGFNLSTETESVLSQIWIKKNFSNHRRTL